MTSPSGGAGTPGRGHLTGDRAGGARAAVAATAPRTGRRRAAASRPAVPR